MDATYTLTAADVARAASATYRQTDYWTRGRLLQPEGAGRGSGYARLYRVEDARLARVCVLLCAAGATAEALHPALRLLDGCGWDGQVVVTTCGDVVALTDWTGEAGWVLDLFAVRMHVEMALAAPEPALA